MARFQVHRYQALESSLPHPVTRPQGEGGLACQDTPYRQSVITAKPRRYARACRMPPAYLMPHDGTLIVTPATGVRGGHSASRGTCGAVGPGRPSHAAVMGLFF